MVSATPGDGAVAQRHCAAGGVKCAANTHAAGWLVLHAVPALLPVRVLFLIVISVPRLKMPPPKAEQGFALQYEPA